MAALAAIAELVGRTNLNPAMRHPMTTSMNAQDLQSRFELRFQSLFSPGRALTFPCDERGRVPLDDLSERARRNYLFARAVVGRDYATPEVIPALA